MPLILDLKQNALFKQGVEEGLAKGQKKGIEKKTKLTAIKMLEKRMPVDEIAELLDVEVDYIVSIQKELNRE